MYKSNSSTSDMMDAPFLSGAYRRRFDSEAPWAEQIFNRNNYGNRYYGNNNIKSSKSIETIGAPRYLAPSVKSSSRSTFRTFSDSNHRPSSSGYSESVVSDDLFQRRAMREWEGSRGWKGSGGSRGYEESDSGEEVPVMSSGRSSNGSSFAKSRGNRRDFNNNNYYYYDNNNNNNNNNYNNYNNKQINNMRKIKVEGINMEKENNEGFPYKNWNNQHIGRHDRSQYYSTGNLATDNNHNNDQIFLKKIQKELEQQRISLKDEVEKLLSPLSADLNDNRNIGNRSQTYRQKQTYFNAEKNSYIDTSGHVSVFKAFVDVSEFPQESISISIDHLGNKVVVEAREERGSSGHVATSFTQKIPIPKYADISNLIGKVNRRGIVKIEIPLLFYFPEDDPSNVHSNVPSNSSFGSSGRSLSNNHLFGNSYINKVKNGSNGKQKMMEIIVKPGWKLCPGDMRVELERDCLLHVIGDQGPGGKKGLVKTYTLPPSALTHLIQGKVSKEGYLVIEVPLRG